jgi:hypothetical protein
MRSRTGSCSFGQLRIEVHGDRSESAFATASRLSASDRQCVCSAGQRLPVETKMSTNQCKLKPQAYD